MAEEKKVTSTDETVDKKVEGKKTKTAKKKPGFFANTIGKLFKFFKDTMGEMKKVVWMSGSDVWKSFKLVIVTVVVISFAIAIVDFASSFIISGIAGLIG